MSITSSVFFIFLSVCVNGIYPAELEPPPTKDRIYAVYIYEPENEEDKELAKMVELIKKTIRSRKKWFLLVDNPLEADIRLEILETGRYYRNYETPPVGREIPGGHEAAYFIEYRYDFSGETRDKMTTTSSSPQIAAKDIARALKSMCDAYLGSESGFR